MIAYCRGSQTVQCGAPGYHSKLIRAVQDVPNRLPGSPGHHLLVGLSLCETLCNLQGVYVAILSFQGAVRNGCNDQSKFGNGWLVGLCPIPWSSQFKQQFPWHILISFSLVHYKRPGKRENRKNNKRIRNSQTITFANSMTAVESFGYRLSRGSTTLISGNLTPAKRGFL